MKKKTKAILIARHLSKEEVQEIKEVYANTELTYAIFLTSIEFLPSSTEQFDYTLVEEVDKNAINEFSFQEVLDFGEIEVGGKTITDLLSFEKMSLWHYQKMRIYFFIRNGFYEISKSLELSEKYEKIKIYTESTAWNFYPYDKSLFEINLLIKAEEEKTNYWSILKYAVFFKLRVFSAFFQIHSLKKVEHILIDHSFKQTVLDIETLKPKQANYNLEYLFGKINPKFLVLDEKEVPKLKGKSKFFHLDFNFKTVRKTLFSELILFKGILSGRVRKEKKAIETTVYIQYQSIENCNLTSTQRFIFNYFKSLHKTNQFFIFKYLSYRNFLCKYPNIKTISSIDENGARIKTIFDAAKQNGIKTYGIQHGAVFDLHPSYMFTSQDKKRNIVPDLTFIWGEYWKRILIEQGNYDADKLMVTGQIRTDVIPKLRIQTPIDTELNPKKRKIFLFASQFQRDENQRKQIALDVFESVKNHNNILLIIKLHPSEKNELEYYHKLAGQVSCTNYKLIYHYDLYKLIAMSDIVSTSFSTVGAEAVYFTKPLIIFDPLKQDLQRYFEQGVAFQVSNKAELEKTILGILSNKLLIKKEMYEHFINEYAYRIDGGVCKRIIEKISF